MSLPCILPPELLLVVFDAACNDDGATAHSLVLVSRSFYFLALPFIYRVLALHGFDQLTILLGRFQHEPHFASLVEHVLIADSGPGPDCLAFENALRILWGLVRSTVKSLALSVNSRNEGVQGVFQTVFDAPFPCLTDLTLCGEHPIPTGKTLAFPALRYFHTAGLTNHNPASCFTPFAIACPRLSHIRVSMGSESNITHAVSAALGLPGARMNSEQMCLDRIPLSTGDERDGHYVPFPVLPSGLVSLVVKPAAPPMALFAGNTSQFYRQYLKQLEELVPVYPQGKMKLLPAFKRVMWDVEIYGATEMKRDWIDNMRGGLGAWAERVDLPGTDRSIDRTQFFLTDQGDFLWASASIGVHEAEFLASVQAQTTGSWHSIEGVHPGYEDVRKHSEEEVLEGQWWSPADEHTDFACREPSITQLATPLEKHSRSR